MRKLMFLVFAIALTITGCVENKTEEEKFEKIKYIDYSNVKVLDSLVNATQYSADTIFLGFTFGMSKQEYKAHIQRLKKDGVDIGIKPNFQFMGYRVSNYYIFTTPISGSKNGSQYTGIGNFILEPKFNQVGRLVELSITNAEEWKGVYGSDAPDWLDERINENYKKLNDGHLLRLLVINEFASEYSKLWKKNNTIIYQNLINSVYVDRKYIYETLLKLKTNSDNIKKSNTKIKI